MSEIDKLIEELEKRYKNEMVLDRIDEFERIKLAGKVELVIEIKNMYKKKDDKTV